MNSLFVFECSICIQNYTSEERKPKSLPCGHTLCASCITDIHSGEVIVCPMCKQEHQISLDKIPINFSLLTIIEDFAKLDRENRDKEEEDKKKSSDAGLSSRHQDVGDTQDL